MVRCDYCPITSKHCPYSQNKLINELDFRLYPREVYSGGGLAYSRDPIEKAEKLMEQLRVTTENCPLLKLITTHVQHK